MQQFLQGLLTKFQIFMYGRYGNDELSKVLMIASLVILALSIFFPLLYPAALALMLWAMFRTYSKNIAKRQRELEWYLRHTDKLRKWFRLRRRMFKERKTHCYFKCPQCKAVIRVPKGRGEIDVGCPRCKTRTKKRT